MCLERNSNMDGDTILLMAGDIGGTNSRFALFRVLVTEDHQSRGPMEHPSFEVVYSQHYLNDQYTMFRDVMTNFLSDAEQHSTFERSEHALKACCLAVAGPVDEGRSTFTNLGWVIDGNDISDWFSIESVAVCNDFVASGYGILTLMESDVTVLQEGKYSPTAPIAVLGAGTGLGECFLAPSSTAHGRFYDAYPSEGGHVEFAPKTKVEFRCLQFLQERFQGRVSVERIVSGKGLLNVYEFFKSEYPNEIDEAKDRKIVEQTEAGAIIASMAYDYPLCGYTMDFVFEAYGTEAGSVALKFLPYGGLYIAGSLAPRNIARLSGPDSSFMKAALNKGRVSPALNNVPIKVVMCEDLGMRGAKLLSYKMYIEAHGTLPALLSNVPESETVAAHDIPSIRKSDLLDVRDTPTITVMSKRSSMDLAFVTEIAVASSIAASIAILIGFGARSLGFARNM